jgi:twinkle protein
MSLESTVRELKRTEEASMLLTDRAIDFDKWQMCPSEIQKIRDPKDWASDLHDHFHVEQEVRGGLLPWSKTHINVRLRPGELSIWAGVNGHGKSMCLSHVLIDLMEQGETSCIASLEMKPVATLARMSRQYVGVEQPSPDAISKFMNFVSGKLYLYDQQGTVNPDKMCAVLRYGREALGVQHFVIDSLMKCGIGVDDYNRQKQFVDRLATYARDSNVHIHLVAHSRKKESEDKPMDKFDVKGSSEITDLADNVFTLWRNKPKEDAVQKGKADPEIQDAPDAILTLDKQRHGEWEGRIPLWFHKRSLQYLGKNWPHSMDYMDE